MGSDGLGEAAARARGLRLLRSRLAAFHFETNAVN